MMCALLLSNKRSLNNIFDGAAVTLNLKPVVHNNMIIPKPIVTTYLNFKDCEKNI